MDKIAINNKIVLMRHAVRKARVAVASKLIKEIKLLNAREHGNKNSIEKCKRKANKLIKELKRLKKLKDDDVSRFAITNMRDIHEVLADTSVNIKSRIMIRLAFHKCLKAKVEEFKSTFPDYLSYFNSEQKMKNKKNKQNKTSVVVEPHHNEEDITDTTSLELQNTRGGDESDCDSAIQNQDGTSGGVRSSELFIISENRNKEGDSVRESKKVVKHLPKEQTITIVDMKPKKSSTVKIVSKLATVKRIHVADNVIENLGTVESITNDVESQEDIVESDEEEIDVFVTNRNINNNYSHMASTNSRNDINRNDKNFNTSSRHNSRDSFISAKEKFQHNDKFSRNRVTPKNKFTDRVHRPLHNIQNKRLKIDNIENPKTLERNTRNEISNEDLHPSWAAKKKQQDILKQGFQGKKIVFNDD